VPKSDPRKSEAEKDAAEAQQAAIDANLAKTRAATAAKIAKEIADTA
jgi:hypothetical protein